MGTFIVKRLQDTGCSKDDLDKAVKKNMVVDKLTQDYP